MLVLFFRVHFQLCLVGDFCTCVHWAHLSAQPNPPPHERLPCRESAQRTGMASLIPAPRDRYLSFIPVRPHGLYSVGLFIHKPLLWVLSHMGRKSGSTEFLLFLMLIFFLSLWPAPVPPSPFHPQCLILASFPRTEVQR